jgi:hypothetical protein
MNTRISATRSLYYGAVIVAALSFWSSGVMLIRFLDTFHLWSHSFLLLGFIYIFSVPVIYVAIRGTKNLFRLFFIQTRGVVYYITSLVFILHALFISLYPSLYQFNTSPALYATAWLLWFGGITMFLGTNYDEHAIDSLNKPART